MKKLIKALFMVVPAILFVFSVCLITDFAFDKLIETNSVVSLMISSGDRTANSFPEFEYDLEEPVVVPVVSEKTLPEGIDYATEDMPIIKYGTNWATLNVDGWNTTDIPVYFGDSDEILTKGAGQWSGSFFCGLGKNCVISAHVMTWFYEIEDTEIGDKVTMQTVYGPYEYEVVDKFIFDESEGGYLTKDYGADTLFLYTCYPRTNGFFRTRQRIALVCSMTKGLIYENIYEKGGE